MALEFPTSPTVGQEYSGFVWDGQKWSTIGTQRATQAEAEAGVENTAYMTSLRTKQAIDVQVIPGLALKVSKTGDTMSGALVLPGDPVSALQASPKQYVDAGDATVTALAALKVAKAGDTMTGALVLPGSPTTGLQAATKAYVDSLASGLVIKAAVAAATTANITLSGEQTVDGVVTNASRVLVKNQTAPAENGIYVSDAGAWSRSTDMDAWTETLAAYTYVQAGTVNIGSSFVSQTAAGGTLGVTAIPFVLFNVNISGAVPISGGTMTGPLILSGDPSAALGAATKQTVDAKVAKAGDTMTGLLVLSADPSATLGAATKQYADAFGNFIQSGTGAVTRTMQNKARERVSVTDFGATGNGSTDDTAAFTNAIASLPNGGTIVVPPGTYKITSTINIGNGTTSTGGSPSTYTGTRLVGETVGNPFSGVATLAWGGALDGTVIKINGAIFGVEVANLKIACADVAAYGIVAECLRYSRFDNLAITGARGTAFSTLNVVQCIIDLLSITVSDVSGSTGIVLDGNADGSDSTYLTTFTNTVVELSASTLSNGIMCRVCDTCMLINTLFVCSGGSSARGVIFDYSKNSIFPSSCSFNGIDNGTNVPAANEWVVVGTPGTFAAPNRIFHLSELNGASYPTNTANVQLDLPKKVTADVRLTGQTSAIGLTNIFLNPSPRSGALYRVNYYLITSSAGTGGFARGLLSYPDAGRFLNLDLGSAISAATLSSTASGSVFVHIDQGGYLIYSVGFSGVTGSFAYDFYLTVERLG